MTEAIGLAASGIAIGTLAAQVTASAIKLKSYYDQLRDAPQDLRDLIDELEILGIVLSDIENDQQQNPISSLILNSNSSSRCLKFCKQGADRLDELVRGLSPALESDRGARKGLASANLVFKKDRLENCKATLERAIRLLMLSHQEYTSCLYAISLER
ncbi:hypothetical protein ACLMJK_009097 [Lecanora helva]